MIPKDSGKIAPATPWIARAAISISIECDSAPTSEPIPNTTSTASSTRSFPNMSPSRPTIGVAIEAVSRKTVSTQVTAVAEAPRSFWIAGSAGTTIVCVRAKASADTTRTPSVRL